MNFRKNLKFFCGIFLLAFYISCSNDSVKDLKGKELKACFTSPDVVEANTPVKFDSSCSINATSFLWKIEGESGYNETPSPSLIFPNKEGVYKVVLTISNGTESKSFSKKITVKSSPNLSVCDGIEHTGTITKNQVWKSGETHCMTGIITLKNATIKIEPGVTVKFSKGAYFIIGGDQEAAIIAEGTKDNPILFTSSAKVPNSGDWSGILLGDKATQKNKFSHCVFEYGGSEAYGGSKPVAMFELSGGTASVENCTFKNAASYAVKVNKYKKGFTSFTKNIIISPSDYGIKTSAWSLHTIGSSNSIQSKGILVEGSEVRETGTWHYQTCPIYVEGHISIGSNEGNTVTIDPGVDIRFLKNVNSNGITVGNYKGGGLIAKGTKEKPIKISSGDSVKEGWSGIKFKPNTSEGTLNYVELSNAGDKFEKAIIEIDNDKVSITNTKISESKGLGILQKRSFVKFENNSIDVSGNFAIEMPVASVRTLGVGNTFGSNNKIKILTNQLSGRITGKHLWRNHNVPYVLSSQLLVGDSNVKTEFNIEAGVTILVAEGGGITVGNFGFASIKAVGTAQSPITFSGYSEEGDVKPGHWQGIFLGPRIITGSKLDYCNISYGGKYANISISSGGAITPDKLTISNCFLNNSSRYGLYIYKANPTIKNIRFSNNAKGDKN